MSKNKKLFAFLYDRILNLAKHRHAPIYLACLSFSEASFFPLPPDFMLAPMAISRPKNAWWYATLTTLCSVLGGVFGYFLGMFFITLLQPYLIQMGYEPAFHQVQQWFLKWGYWALFLAGFTPIPYKIFTLSSGAVGMPLIPFILISFLGRGSRFYLVSGLIWAGGEKMKNSLRTYIDWVGWFTLGIIGLILFIYYCYK
jgi:membrane protein YqaA with SNARE-associated domain